MGSGVSPLHGADFSILCFPSGVSPMRICGGGGGRGT